MTPYDYRCDSCGVTIEISKSMDSPHPTTCPECGKDGLRRLFGPVAFDIRGDHLIIKHPQVETAPGVTVQPRSS
jgi:putative FmdB family regulatory protein